MGRGFLNAGLLLAACLLASVAGPVRSSASPVPGVEFAARIDRATSALQAASVDTSAGALAAVAAVDAQLPPDLSVSEGTRTIAVDPTGVTVLTSRLREAGTPRARRAAAGRLVARLASMRTALGAPVTNPSDPAALEELLAARPQTSRTGENWLNDQLRNLLQTIVRWLAGLFPQGEGSAQGAGRLIPLLVLLVPVLLAFLVLLRAWLKRGRTREGTLPSVLADANAPVVAAAADLPADAASYAEVLAGGGRYRDAVRALYGGAARHLADTGVVRRMRTRTNLEMLRDVRGSAPGIAPAFGELTRRFEAVWYGHADPGNSGYVEAKVAYERVVSAMAKTVRAASGTGSAPSGGPALIDAPKPAGGGPR